MTTPMVMIIIRGMNRVTTMTKLVGKKPHPAKAARILATGASATAFMSMITVFSYNAHSAAALAPVDSAVPLAQGSATPAAPTTPGPASATPAPATTVVKAAAPKAKATKKPVTPATVKKTTTKKVVVKKKVVAPKPKATVTSKPVVVPPVTTPTQGTSGGSRKP